MSEEEAWRSAGSDQSCGTRRATVKDEFHLLIKGGNVVREYAELQRTIVEILQLGKGLCKKHKGIVVLAVVAVLVIAVIFTSAAADDPEEVARTFEKAVYNKDVDALEEIVAPDDDRMKIDRKYLEQFLELMHTNDAYMETTMSNLQYQLAFYQDRNVVPPDVNFGVVDYYLKREEGILFDSYSVGVRPYYLYINTIGDGGTVKLNGKIVLGPKEGRRKVYGPLMPGHYTVEGSKKYPYALVEDIQEMDLFADNDGQVAVNLDLTGEYVELHSDFENTRVLVNGKPLKKTVEKLGGSFGPVSLDGSITLQGERKFPWGVARSDKQKLTEDTTKVYLTPNPFNGKKAKNEKNKLINTINTHFKQWEQAKVKRDPSVYTVGDDNMKRELIAQIESIKTDMEIFPSEDPYQGVALGTRIDFDIMDFTYKDDHYVIEIPVEFHSKNNDNFKERMEEEFETFMVTLRYNEKGKRWLVHKCYEDYGRYFEGKGVVKSEFK